MKESNLKKLEGNFIVSYVKYEGYELIKNRAGEDVIDIRFRLAELAPYSCLTDSASGWHMNRKYAQLAIYRVYADDIDLYGLQDLSAYNAARYLMSCYEDCPYEENDTSSLQSLLDYLQSRFPYDDYRHTVELHRFKMRQIIELQKQCDCLAVKAKTFADQLGIANGELQDGSSIK